MQHLININQFSQAELTAILDKAQQFVDSAAHIEDAPALTGKTVANLFFENSTRTLCSFELAAKKLSAHVLNLNVSTSSTQKGETVLDTIATIEAMGVDVFVVRHGDDGIMQVIAEYLGDKAHVVNAGEGSASHPTQALLDLLTIRQHKLDFKNLSIAIVGDILHSRVARSQIAALKIMGVKDIRVIAPQTLLPEDVIEQGVKIYSDFNEGIKDVDVVSMLRIQHERMISDLIPNKEVYFNEYALTQQRLAYAKPDAIVMHPGPMNREVEIASDVADGEQSVILQQVKNGVAVRMAVLSLLK
tara:strand:+ start:34646 stop:35551 length:906 start_codon:yes stop_codon:yes gene_type:complete